MRITYVLAYPELNGGNKVVSQHAALLAARGHEVTVLAQGERPDWFPSELSYRDTSAGVTVGSQDLVIANFWTTIPIAIGLGVGPVAHFCQGYEGDLVHLRDAWPAIAEAYAAPLPGLAVTPHLAAMVTARFGRPCRVVPPPIDRRFRPRWRWGLSRHPMLVVPGIFEAEVKDTPTALRAVGILRAAGWPVRVTRLSILPLSLAERRLLDPDLYLANVPPEIVAQVLRSADLLLLPSRPGEGFGLPLLEAMASGVPAVASRLPSTEWIAGEDGAGAALVPAGDAVAFADAAAALLRRGPWRRARARGLAAVERFSPERVGDELETAVRWAAAAAPSLRPATAEEGP